jgi:hypothetical protein
LDPARRATPLAKKLALAGKKTADRKTLYWRHLRKRWLYTYQNHGGHRRVAYLAGKCNEMGVTIKGYTVDMRQIKNIRTISCCKSRNGGQAAVEKTKNLDLLFGEATFIDKKTISVKPENGKG